MRKHLLLILSAVLLASAGWAQDATFLNGGGDGLYSNPSNWNNAFVPSSTQSAQFNSINASLDVNSTINQLRGAGDAILADGGGTLTLLGVSAPPILMVTASANFTVDCKVDYNGTNTNVQFNQSSTLTFGSNSDLTLSSLARLTAISGISGTVNFDGIIRGSNNLQFGPRADVVFGSTSDNSNYTGDFVYVAASLNVVANTADNGIFVPSGRKVQINGNNGTLTLNGSNIYQGNLTVGGSNNFRLEVNKNQESIGNLILGTGILTIALGDNVGSLAFNNNSASTWEGGSSNLTIENFKNGVLRFGTDASGLTAGQLAQISIGGGTVYLDANGYLIETGSPVYASSAWSVAPGVSDNAVIADNYSDGNLEVNDLTIQSGATVDVAAGETIKVNGDLINQGTLNIASGGSLVVIGSAVGDATITRNTTGADGYSIIGSPVMGATLDNLVTQGASHLYESDGTNYTAVTSGAMAPGKGYFMAQVGVPSPSVSFTGTLVSGDVSATVASSGYTLLANPYAAAVSVDLLIASDVANATTGSVYVWSDGGTNGVTESGKRDGTYLVSNQLTTSGVVGSVQGFFVQGQNGGDVTFTPAMQQSAGNTDASFYRKAAEEKQILKLSISGNELYHETVVGFVDGATLGRDFGLDAQYLRGNDFISFYSKIDDVKFATQGLPLFTDESLQVDLGMDLAEAGTYAISVEEFSGFSDDLSVTLVDNLTGERYLLGKDFSVSFSTETVTDANRFSVVVEAAAILNTSAIDGLEVLTRKDMVVITPQKGNAIKGQLTISDIQGRTLLTQTLDEASDRVAVPFNFESSKLYLLRFHVNGTASSMKVLFTQ